MLPVIEHTDVLCNLLNCLPSVSVMTVTYQLLYPLIDTYKIDHLSVLRKTAPVVSVGVMQQSLCLMFKYNGME
jgi:hypothetical protein